MGLIRGARHSAMTTQLTEASEQAPEHEQKRAALGYLNAAWVEARIEGIAALLKNLWLPCIEASELFEGVV